jgi:hypothetical protein
MTAVRGHTPLQAGKTHNTCKTGSPFGKIPTVGHFLLANISREIALLCYH